MGAVPPSRASTGGVSLLETLKKEKYIMLLKQLKKFGIIFIETGLNTIYLLSINKLIFILLNHTFF